MRWLKEPTFNDDPKVLTTRQLQKYLKNDLLLTYPPQKIPTALSAAKKGLKFELRLAVDAENVGLRVKAERMICSRRATT